MVVRSFFLPCITLLAAASLFAACAKAADFTDDDEVSDAASADATVVSDAASSSGKASSSSSSSGGSSGASSGGSSGGSSSGSVGECGDLKINEIRSDSDDFVEIYNAGDCDVDLGDYSLVYRSATGTSDVVLYKDGTDTLGPQEFFVVGETSMTPKDAPFAGGSLGATGGQLAIKMGSSIVDSVGYGSSTGSYVEGNAAPAPGSGSIGRTPDGHDTDENSDDFATGSATPGDPNE